MLAAGDRCALGQPRPIHRRRLYGIVWLRRRRVCPRLAEPRSRLRPHALNTHHLSRFSNKHPTCNQHQSNQHPQLLLLHQPMSYQSPKPHPSYSQHFNTHKPHKHHQRRSVPHPCRSLLHPVTCQPKLHQQKHNRTVELPYHTSRVTHPCRSLLHPVTCQPVLLQRKHNHTIELPLHPRSVPHPCRSLPHPQRFRNNSSLVQPQKAKRVRAERTWIFEVYTPSGAAGQKARAHRPHPEATPAPRPGAC